MSARLEQKRKEAAELGMKIFIVIEGMFFLTLLFVYGVLYQINTAGSDTELQNSAILMLCGSRGMSVTSGNYWFPDEIALPVEVTAITTLILLASGMTIWLANRYYAQQKKRKGSTLLIFTIIGGCIFLLVQGFEWFRLVQSGLSADQYRFGALFYLIIGAHAIHVMGGIGFLLYCLWNTIQDHDMSVNLSSLRICKIYWLFVVLLWPLLYWILYIP